MNNIEKEGARFFRILGRAYGLSDVMMNVTAILYMQPDEISLEDLARKTGYSLATISNTVKTIVAIGMAQKQRKPGSGKVYIYMEKNLAKINLQKLNAAQKMLIDPAKDILPPIISKYKPKVKDEKMKKQLHLIEDYYRQIQTFAKLIEKWTADLEDISKKENMHKL